MVVQVDWEFFRAQLPSDFRELAVERGLIHPQLPQLKTKVTDIEPVLRLVLHRAGLDVSLATTASEAATAQVIELSSVAIHKWERKLAPYLAELSTRMLAAGTGLAPGTWAGYDILPDLCKSSGDRSDRGPRRTGPGALQPWLAAAV